MNRFLLFLLVVGLASSIRAAENTHSEKKSDRRVVVIVWDGMRPDFISQEHTPALWRLAHEGVMFQNHHAVYVSATDVNGTDSPRARIPNTAASSPTWITVRRSIRSNRFPFPTAQP